VKSLLKKDRPRTPTDIHGASRLKFNPSEKANAIAIWKLISHHMICVTKTINGGWRLKVKLYLKPQTRAPLKR
jgi:hypothetical protein